ncbi:MAG TPA: hypothetical protein VE377_19220 [Candidatus Dormibacteraeota bacterium]|nr:hypothetical protein [Candidatus Dormibacteraeota bacterium]
MSVSRHLLSRFVWQSIVFLSICCLLTGTSVAPVSIDDLFKQADLVAIVHILSGDSEHYPVTVYKGKVETAVKGTATGEIIYFGPYVSYGVGSEYLVFLRKSEKGIEPRDKSSGINYGSVPTFFQGMYGGFSIMPIEYACVFEGKEVSQQCDYAVKLNPEQTILPPGIQAFLRGEVGAATNSDKWVRREAIVSFLKYRL